MAKLLYQGHGSLRLTLENGKVLYLDPYAGTGYDLPADYVLITHEHYDHNKLDLLTLKDSTVILRAADMLGADGSCLSRQLKDLRVTALPAYNQNHSRTECVGYLIEADGICLYAAGDTSTTDAMPELASKTLDYALLPCDGIYNMDIAEAIHCADLIGAKHTIPIHVKPGALYDSARARQFTHPSALYVKPGEEILL